MSISTARGSAIAASRCSWSTAAPLPTSQQGIEDVPDFVDALLEHDLLESFALDVELADGGQHRLSGFYTVHEERLSALQAEPLARLHHAGYLGPVYMAIASLSQFRALIERMQRATDRDAQ
jgi:hypothetical protein